MAEKGTMTVGQAGRKGGQRVKELVAQAKRAQRT